MEKFLLSVDGGGTKTEFCVSDGNGAILHSVTVGCSNYKSVGIDGVYKSFRDGAALLEARGVRLADISYSVWGISGCDSAHDHEIIGSVIKRIGIPEHKRYLCNDGILAYYAQADDPGIVVIAGTGSIILGVDGNGNHERAGGWGYNISDIGSGYWIGAELLKRTLLYCDGCGKHSPLYDMVREYFKCESFGELPYIVTEVLDFYEIAGLARLAAEAGERGEMVSLEILKEGAAHLAALTGSIYRRLNFHSGMELSIVFSGGVLKCGIYEALMKTALKAQFSLERVRFLSQENTPAYGGIKLAKRFL